MSGHQICEADNFTHRMACGRCALTWPITAQGAARPDCRPKGTYKPITLVEMWDVANAVAEDELGSQRALIAAAIREAPDMPTMRKIAVFRALAVLVDRVRNDSEFLERMREAAG